MFVRRSPKATRSRSLRSSPTRTYRFASSARLCRRVVNNIDINTTTIPGVKSAYLNIEPRSCRVNFFKELLVEGYEKLELHFEMKHW